MTMTQTTKISTTRRVLSSTTLSPYENIILTHPSPSVCLVTLNRPKALNALSSPLFHELNHAFKTLNTPESSTDVIILTGSEKAFAAGADIKEMKDRTLQETYGADFLTHWTQINTVTKPIIAAVSGFALGGGCELAMMYVWKMGSDIRMKRSAAVLILWVFNTGVTSYWRRLVPHLDNQKSM